MEKETEIAVLKTNLENMKTTNLEAKVSNTAEHLEIKTTLTSIVVKLDSFIEKKADKSDVSKLDQRFWRLVVGMLMLLAGLVAEWLR